MLRHPSPYTLTISILWDTLYSMIEIRQTGTYETWFDKLSDSRAKARIDVRIRRLSLGNPGDVRSVGEGVMEMRVDYGPGYRIYFVQEKKKVIILLAGGDKSSQVRDIAHAKKLAGQLREEA